MTLTKTFNPMKYLTPFIFFIFIFSTYSFGQLQRGTWTINANSAGLFVKPDESTSGLALSTDIAYFPTKWLLLGAEFSYVMSGGLSTVIHEISPSPYLRFYFNPANKTKFYGQLGSEIILSYRTSSNGNSGFDYSSRFFRPEVGIGFNHFIRKNIAIEAGINMAAFEAGRYKNNTYTDSYATFDEGILITPHIGMRLFLNTNDEQGDEESRDYLQARTYTVGLFVNYLHHFGYDFSAYDMVFNIQYFTARYFSMGASFQMLGEEGENVMAFAPIIEYYIPTTAKTQLVPSISANIFSDELPTTYNFGLKVNTFIGDNISFWAGPFALYSPQNYSKEWYFYAGAGVNYFMQSQKNRG